MKCVNLLIPYWSWPCATITDDSLFTDTIVVPPGFESMFHSISDSDEQKAILFSGHASFNILLNFVTFLFQWTIFFCQTDYV